jgi:DNA helicase HerA-like ATPase
MTVSPTLLGHIGAVSGSTVSIQQIEGAFSGILIIGGRSYRIGQVGSFVRIPQGYHNLYGIVCDVGANATPEALKNFGERGHRWMTVQLVGEIIDVSFERGISQYPTINDEVHLVTEEDLAKIYGTADNGQIPIGRLSAAESIPVRVDLDKLVTRHSAVLGSTGSGKSTTVTSLLRSIAGKSENSTPLPNARILLVDIHGEYASALKGVAEVFRVNPTEGEKQLYVPYWATETAELLSFLMGKIEDKAFTAILDKILDYKRTLIAKAGFDGIDENALTAESPLPFSLKQLWFDLYDPEHKTWDDKDRTIRAILAEGDAETLKEPKYKTPSPNNTAPWINQFNVLSIRRQLDHMRSRLLDKQYDFILRPGEWEPDLTGKTVKDLGDLLDEWMGHEKPITILDLSGVPSVVLIRLVGSILNIIYEAIFWGRELPEGGRLRPELVVMEEAHRYLGKETNNLARTMVQRIVKEGRKFGIGAMIISQRPTEIDETILSQCGTFIALRLSNSADRTKVQAALPDSLSGLMDSLPVLRTGEAIIAGEAAKLPIRCRVTLPPVGARPSSEDPLVAEAWSKDWAEGDYERVAAAWRAQNPRWKPEAKPKGKGK